MNHDNPPPHPLPTCINHPGRETVGTIDDHGVCAECVEAELLRYRMWLRSQQLVRGGVDVWRPV